MPSTAFPDTTPFVVLGPALTHDTTRERFWRAVDAYDNARVLCAFDAHWIAREAINGHPIDQDWVADYRRSQAAEDYARAVYETEVAR